MRDIFWGESCPTQINGWLSTLAAVTQAVVSGHGNEERAAVFSEAQSSLQLLTYGPTLSPDKNVDIG